MRVYFCLTAGALLLSVGTVGWKIEKDLDAITRRDVARELQNLSFAPYAAQKVVYHVTTPGGLFDQGYLDLLGGLANHLRAVGPGNLSARVVLQAQGLDLLLRANSNNQLRNAVDSLRSRGVKFEVGLDSMIERGLALESLYGVAREDVVAASVAEVSALQGQGYVYVRF